jgi:O-antigen/teichoic acid export membrane protein
MAVTFLERYINVASQFIMTAIVARLMTPEEFGLVAVGVSILAIMETIRDFGISNYIVQHKNLTREVARTGFTVIAIISLVIAVFLVLSASSIADFYGDKRLIPYIEVMALVAIVGMIGSPLRALMLRDMQFGSLALVNFSATLAFAGTVIGLVLFGFSYMSYAWGGLAMTATTAGACLYYRRDFWIFRPGFREWSGALAFGSYSGLSDTLSRLNESLPFLILGRFMPFGAVGIFNRSHFLSTVPPKLLMVGIVPVALPGFAAEARSGRDLKTPLLNALSFIAVFLWPALLLLALVAQPAVLIVLGNQWLDAIPIVQILSIAGLASVPMPLTFPVLSAVGRVKEAALIGLIIVPVSALVLALSANFGLYAVTASFLFLTPFQAATILWLMRRYIPFAWHELGSALTKSAAVTVVSVIPPAIAIAANGFSLEISIPAGLGIGMLMVIGWLFGVWWFQHMVLDEIRLASGAVVRKLGICLPKGT